MQAKIIDRKWVVEWFDERQCYHMPSLTLADNGNLLAVWNGGFLQWNGDPMGRDAKDWVSVLEPGAKEWSNPDAVGCDIRYCRRKNCGFWDQRFHEYGGSHGTSSQRGHQTAF